MLDLLNVNLNGKEVAVPVRPAGPHLLSQINRRGQPMLLKDEQGVTSIEYALIALLIALGILSSLKLLGTDVTALYKSVAATVIAAAGG